MKVLENIAVFFIKAIILVLGFLLWTGLAYGFMGTMQTVCNAMH